MYYLSLKCIKETLVSIQCLELSKFNDYFIDRDYDAFTINTALNNNILTFTMLYVYNKLNWKENLSAIKMSKY